MARLTKRNYTDGVTVITAENLNAIQDEILQYRVEDVTYTSSSHQLKKKLNGSTTNVVTFGSIIDLGITEVTS